MTSWVSPPPSSLEAPLEFAAPLNLLVEYFWDHRSALMWGGVRGDILPLVGGISKATNYNVLFGLFVGGMVRNENVL